MSQVLPPCGAVLWVPVLGTVTAGTRLHQSWLVKAEPPRLPHAAPLCTGLLQSHFSSKKLSRKLTFGSSQDTSIPQKRFPIAVQHSREDLCSAAAPWRSMSQGTAISFPPASASEQLSGAGWHEGTGGSCTLLPPGGTRKGCRSKS